MEAKHRISIERCKQVNAFIDSKPEVLAQSPFGYTKQVSAFKTAFGTIVDAAANHSVGVANKAAEQRRVLRYALRVKQLHPLRNVARVLDGSVAGMTSLVEIPRKFAGIQKLLSTASAVAEVIAPYQAEFIAKGMPDDFLGRLRQTIAALQSADAVHTTARQSAKSAKMQLTAALVSARSAIVGLDVIIRRVCDDDPASGSGALAVWNSIVPLAVKEYAKGGAVSGTVADVSGDRDGSTAPALGLLRVLAA